MSVRMVLLAIAVTLAWSGPVSADTTASAPSSTLSDKEKADRASAMLKSMEGVIAELDRKIDGARGDTDVLRVNCLLDNKEKMAGLFKQAGNAYAALEGFLGDRQSEALEHEFQKIDVIRVKIDQYKKATESCVGNSAFSTTDKLVRKATDANTDSQQLDTTKGSTAATGGSSTRVPAASPNK